MDYIESLSLFLRLGRIYIGRYDRYNSAQKYYYSGDG